MSEVKSTVEYKDGTLYIGLTDSANQPVNDLEINHEKLMHFYYCKRGPPAVLSRAPNKGRRRQV
ncbi:hypothetical protein GCM10020331_054320 [Ectobacillus funiculus]